MKKNQDIFKVICVFNWHYYSLLVSIKTIAIALHKQKKISIFEIFLLGLSIFACTCCI